MKESKIQKMLIDQLNIIQDDLVFIEKEKYFPSVIGTKSFVDIFAKDGNGRFVIIELKRSNISARQAIHELLKYLEALKENISIKEDEIKLIVISTEWQELLVPFSSFVQKVELDVEGFQLFIEEEKLTLSAVKISPIDAIADRFISSVQMARYYSDKESLEKGVEAHKEAFRVHEINEYILIILKAPPNYGELVKQSTEQSIELMISNLKIEDAEEIERLRNNAKNIETYEYMIYSANQILSEQKYINILYKLSEDAENIEGILDENEFSTLDKLEALNELLINCEPFPDSNFVEIGTPAKFDKFIYTEEWELIEVLKFGKLAENVLLTEEIIISEILGFAGATKERYKSDVNFESKSNISKIKKEIGHCLSDNIAWKSQINFILDSLIDDKNILKCHVSIYNPMNILYTIHLVTTRPEWWLYVPIYQIHVFTKEQEILYFGYQENTTNKLNSLKDLLDEFYEGKKENLFFPLTWGGYEENNIKICKALGLQYKTKLIKKSKNESKCFVLENFEFVPCTLPEFFEDFVKFINTNEKLCDDINEIFNDNYLGNSVYNFR